MKYLVPLILIILTGCSDAWTDENKHMYIDFNDTTSVVGKPTHTDVNSSSNYIRIAVAPMTTPEDNFLKYNELFTYMEEKLGKEIILVQRKTYKEINNLLKQNKIDLAFICSGAYVAGIEDSAFDLFLIGERNNQRYYHAYVIVRSDSQIDEYSDLSGKTFVFSDSLSNTGMFYPLKLLNDLNTNTTDFFSRTYFSNAHDNSLELVNRGIIDGASVNSIIYDYTLKTDPEKVMNLKIINKSQSFGMPPIVVSKGIDERLKSDIYNVMTNLVKEKKGREILKSLMINRFVSDSDTLYNGIREMCRGICYYNITSPDERTALSPTE